MAHLLVECKRNVMAHAQKPDSVFQRNGRVHLYRRRCQFSRVLALLECGSGENDCSRARSKRDGTRAETRFGLSAKRTSPFKSAWVSVQSTAGNQGVRISGQQLYRPCSVVQFEAPGYPLHSHLSPSLPLPCVTVCHQIPNEL